MENTQTPAESPAKSDQEIIDMIREGLVPIEDLARPPLDEFLDRVGSARVVLLGESTHGTKDFYELRALMTQKLIQEKGFNLVCLEADWPDAEKINDYIHGRAENWDGFHRFPEWMWRNKSFAGFVESLKKHNASERNLPVSVFGLDLYSLSASLDAVVKFLDQRDPEAGRLAREVHECLNSWRHDPSRYGLAVWNGVIKGCEQETLAVLRELHENQFQKLDKHEPRLLSALQNARVLKNAEEYYRVMYEGSVDSWNLRDRHMFETLLLLMDHFGPESKVVIWEHNSHIGDAAATEVARIGELNVGQLCRAKFGTQAYLTGFMSDHGTVAAASHWGGEVMIKQLRPARPDSFEHLLHSTSVPSYFLPLRAQTGELKDSLKNDRLERAVGVLYLPQTERSSHYFRARLSEQFDEIVWIDETSAVEPLAHVAETDETDTYPFGI